MRMLLIVLTAVLMNGCAQLPELTSFTVNDLDQAIVIADTTNQPGKAACMRKLRTIVEPLQDQSPTQTGVFTLWTMQSALVVAAQDCPTLPGAGLW